MVKSFPKLVFDIPDKDMFHTWLNYVHFVSK